MTHAQAQVSKVRSAILKAFDEDDSDWLSDRRPSNRLSHLDPHISEHEARAAELLAEQDEDAAIIHQLLGRNILRAAGET